MTTWSRGSARGTPETRGASRLALAARALVPAAVVLVLGFSLSVAVAWAGMFAAKTPVFSASETARLRRAMWAETGAESDTIWIHRAYCDRWLDVVRRTRDEAGEVEFEHRVGWPLRCLRARAIRPVPPSDPVYLGGVRLGQELELMVDYSTATTPRGLKRFETVQRVWPAEPIPAGLAANSALFAGAPLALWWLARGARGVVRRWRKRCPRCGYPGGAFERCPECGRRVRRPDRPGAAGLVRSDLSRTSARRRERPALQPHEKAPMTTTDVTGATRFARRTDEVLRTLKDTGQLKVLQTIEGPMDATVRLRGHGEVACFCSNNYLGLANHPEVVEAGLEGLRQYGAGTASVRFICGTFEPHERLERRLAEFLGVEAAYTFVSCWTATEALFPTVCEPGDAIVSDELNHACIIDSMRLCAGIKKNVRRLVYAHSDMASLREVLEKARDDREIDGVVWVITDGVFSMEGDLADMKSIRGLCDEFGAVFCVDDSHGTGVMGETGRGTHEHDGLPGRRVDFFTGTLGKALGGGAGGYLAGSRAGIDLIVQRGRPTLFSNALPATVACSADKAIEVLMREPERVARLRDNVAYARRGIRNAGFDVLESPTAICPIIVGDTAKAISMSRRLLESGVYVIGFGYPVVPEGTARLRVQISAAHEREHLDRLVEALEKLKAES